MKRIISNWQGLLALLIAAAIFYFSPVFIRLLDPTAGAFDLGYLQRPLVAASYFFFATFCAWTALQVDFPTLDRWIDRKGFEDAFAGLSGTERMRLLTSALAILFAGYLVCLWLVPV